jgi:hypothetical protein
MAHKKKSKGTGTYASQHHYEKNKVRKLETYIAHNPNDLESMKKLQALKEEWKSIL